MTAAELIGTLEAAGVVFLLEGEGVTVDAPKGAITPDLRALLAADKPEVIDRLQERAEHQALAAANPNPLFQHFIKAGGWVGVSAQHGEASADYLHACVMRWAQAPGQTRAEAERKYWATWRKLGGEEGAA